jgi:hypothetical protein
VFSITVIELDKLLTIASGNPLPFKSAKTGGLVNWLPVVTSVPRWKVPSPWPGHRISPVFPPEAHDVKHIVTFIRADAKLTAFLEVEVI